MAPAQDDSVPRQNDPAEVQDDSVPLQNHSVPERNDSVAEQNLFAGPKTGIIRSARRGIIHDIYQGVLQAPARLRHPPFEITFETPQLAPQDLQIAAVDAALRSILAEYRSFVALAQNI